MLATISRALEARDHVQGHGARVAALAEPVARRLGWAEERIAALRFGAPLHDIGKVTVRGELLRQPGPLTVAEQLEIRVHPTAGAALVAPLRFARHALSYVLFHHERWDGGGYPCGLSGGAIPLEARLLGVADAFDAMTSARPYRSALSTEQALAELAICAGSQFDPLVVDAFLETWAHHAGAWRAGVPS
jgi:HD-GYP domain-containing protein (c-di-GMP phosphodiesterase class II)